jgi:hypothetical protein
MGTKATRRVRSGLLRSAAAGVFLAGALIAADAEAAPRPLSVDGGVGVGYDDNVAAAANDRDEIDGAFYWALVAAEYTVPFAERYAIVLRGQLQGDLYDKVEDLSNGRALALVRTSWKPGKTFLTPVISAWVSGARREYGSRIRSGNEFRGGLFVIQQITTRLSARAELEGFHRQAEGRVFDVSGQGAGLSVDWRVTPMLSAQAGFDWWRGDVTSSASSLLPVGEAADASEPDDAFGGSQADWHAYRLDARTRVAMLGANWRIARNWALDARLQSVTVDGDHGARYERVVGVVGVLAKF